MVSRIVSFTDPGLTGAFPSRAVREILVKLALTLYLQKSGASKKKKKKKNKKNKAPEVVEIIQVKGT